MEKNNSGDHSRIRAVIARFALITAQAHEAKVATIERRRKKKNNKKSELCFRTGRGSKNAHCSNHDSSTCTQGAQYPQLRNVPSIIIMLGIPRTFEAQFLLPGYWAPASGHKVRIYPLISEKTHNKPAALATINNCKYYGPISLYSSSIMYFNCAST